MRALVALLLIANLAWLALARGWLQPWVGLSQAHEREPQRIAAQIQPETVRVVRLASPSAAAATTVCLQAGPFDEGQLAAVEQALGTLPAGSWQRVQEPGGAETAAAVPAARQIVRIERADDSLRRQADALHLPGGFVACPR